MSIFEKLFGEKNLVGKSCPEIPEGIGLWLGLNNDGVISQPLKIKDLRAVGKAVLLDFWAYSDVNSLQDLPYLKRWQEKYFPLGLVVIGIHTPEFDFEADPRNVENFIKKEGITYPVVLDLDRRMWNLFANDTWPRMLLVDTKGKIRYDHRGGDHYLEAETKIQGLLKEINSKVDLPKMAAEELDHIKEVAVHYPQTQKTYCGYQKGKIGNQEGYFKDTFHVYDKVPPKDSFKDGHLYLNGGWIAKADYLQHAVNNRDPIDFLILPFRGLAANVVLGLDETKGVGETKIYVALDDAPPAKEVAGKDMLFDESGWSYLLVKEPRLYELFKTKEFADHLLKIYPFSDALQIYAFSFVGRVE
ncbi:MAG: hypothetical protein A2126_01610 [Candidatus Woykebacteria bacterium GWB1_45_5]|uniref:Thioredoxin domain-containing protein n=2 Tax=Candidatus Woykeibacteriota TaxID=1817899 RepID=A0A1G1W4Q1_9BACT|nr:MAG: hypothetical protein A2113_02125 [Candidatus Woykebacteria bacterium GWA1_44_8]OGY23103.1 MAG: hypothetical protein A2126_01610 [Candidatus Woykebacteria bacterium GWB1_45_5]